jgi:UDP-3-O-[3-hydroxymyristoyl] glucosamine N-acyltransferase
MKLRELADRIGGRITGKSEVEITGVSSIDDAREGDITFLLDQKNLEKIAALRASAVIVKKEIKECSRSMLVSDNPQYTFARALEVFYGKPYKPSGISDKAYIGSNVTMGDDVSIHPNAYVNSNASLGSRVTLSPGVFIGDGASIGDDSFIYPNATIRENVSIGRNVIVHSGAVIGSDGYGYVLEKGKHYKIPQVGGVIIEDEVEVGANVCIDRGTLGNTVIGWGTKIDNLVQIAHNVKIGKNCIIVSQVGISGSVEVGDGVILAGQVGIRDHMKIGSKAMIGSQSGVGSHIPGGQVYSGSPAIPHSKWLRAQSIFSKLPEYAKRIQKLEKNLDKEELPDDEHP